MTDADLRCYQLREEIRSLGYRIRYEEREEGHVVSVVRTSPGGVSVFTTKSFAREIDAWELCRSEITQTGSTPLSQKTLPREPPDLEQLKNEGAALLAELEEKEQQKESQKQQEIQELCRLTAKQIEEDIAWTTPEGMRDRVLMRLQDALVGTIATPELQKEFQDILGQVGQTQMADPKWQLPEAAKAFADTCLNFMTKVYGQQP